MNLPVTSGWAEGMTPLHLAIDCSHESSAEVLIKNGAEVNTKNNSGKTPLTLANEKDLTSIVSLLTEVEGDESRFA